jgi:diketogulonate reductase-like aldo/keto reductase
VLLAPNLAMPAVAQGTGEQYKGDTCVAAVTSAIGLGYRNIDTLSATVELKEHR